MSTGSEQPPSSLGNTLVITTHRGLEELVARELRQACGPIDVQLRPDDFVGRVSVADREDVLAAALKLRSAHHVIRIRRVGTARSLEEIVAFAEGADMPDLEGAESFAVRCRRVGEHDFRSPEVERSVGAVFYHRCHAVNLKEPALTIRIDVRGDKVSIGSQITPAAMSHRYYPRPYQQRTSLKANVAYACLQGLSFVPKRMLDPFCGSGTMLLEAGHLWPEAELCGGDKKPVAVAGARANLEAYGVKATLIEGQAERVPSLWSRKFDAIVSNPPFGVRMGGRLDFERFYADLLSAFDRVLEPGGEVVLLVVVEPAMEIAAKAAGWNWEVLTRVETGSVRPGVFHLWRAG